MENASSQVWVLFSVVGAVLYILFCRPPWRLLGIILGVGLRLLKWAIAVGLVWGTLNCAQVYQAWGWTPLSLMLGDHVYDLALHRGKYAPIKAQPPQPDQTEHQTRSHGRRDARRTGS